MLPEACQGRRRKKTIIRWTIVVIILCVILLVLSLILYYIKVKTTWIQDFFSWVQSIKLWGNLVLVIVLAVLNFPFTFGWMLVAMVCGLLYGFLGGLITVVIGSTIGAILAFIFLRRFLRKPAMKYIEKKGGYVARSIMYELRNHQIKVSIMVRAGPVPPGLQNAILAVSPMGLPLYTATTIPGMLIKEIPYVYIGSSLYDFFNNNESDNVVNDILLVVGFFACVAMFIFILWVSRKAMQDAKKLKLKEETEKIASMTNFPEAEDDFTELLHRKLEYDPYQQSDPVLNFFGLGYNTNEYDDEDEYFNDDDSNLI